VKRFASFAGLAFSLFLVACGSGQNISPPPPVGGFSNASLKGQYAFSMTGVFTNGGYLARVGSFSADGNGSITAGLEDVVQGNSGATQISFTGGSYSIQQNGTGVLTFTGVSGNSLQLSITLLSVGHGNMVQTDLTAATSGNFALQTPSTFTVGSLTGNFVLDCSGISFSGTTAAPLSVIGQIALDGNGNVTGGTLDENDGTLSGPIVAQAGTYQLDSNGNGSAFGRGTITFDARSFAFYVVDNTHLKLVEEDLLAATQGDANLQSGAIPTQNSAFNGSFVFLVSGASLLANQGNLLRVGRFTADGNGGIANISLDQNYSGSTTHVSQGSNITNASYSIDTSHAGSGRGTFTFTDSNIRLVTFIFYLYSPTQAVIQDVTNGLVANGPMQVQTGSPFTNTNLAGNYEFFLNGIQIGQQDFVPSNENFVGQYALSTATSSNLTGVVDYTEQGTTGSTLYSNNGIAGTLALNSDGTLNNGFQIVTGSPSSTTFNFVAYIVSPTSFYIVSTDSTRVVSGIAAQQSQ
jgi:hypothetical protein